MGKPDSQEGSDSEVDPWASLHTTVRELDKNKVKDCKEDVDTLLVFAGLYSAVLTAFLIESYRNLQEDPQQTIIQLLRQIALQPSNDEITTRGLASLPEFHAAVADIRVNVCWFASLILSLTAASYGILVKQWLREYLAIDSTVPQECIRIRHFRYRGLRDWKLFEIAAMLPLLLQVSLALFFTGLCFFTSAVHPSIGGTSIGLVGGWALFFLLAVLAPIFSARCPYKTTFLKHIFSGMRSWCVRFIMRVASKMLYTWLKSVRSATAYPNRSLPLNHGPVGTFVVQAVAPAQADPMVQARIDATGVIRSLLAKYPPQDDRRFTEEDDLRRKEEHDLIIFSHVDSVLLDDSVLNTMRLVLKRRLQPAKNVLGFVVTCIRNRISIQPGSPRAPVFPGLHIISPVTRIHLVDILSDALHNALTKTTVDQWYIDGGVDWMDDALTLIFALVPPTHPTPENVTFLFRQLLAPSPRSGHYDGCGLLSDLVISKACGQDTSEEWQAAVFTGLADALKTVHPDIFRDIAHWSYVQDEELEIGTVTFDHILAKIRDMHSKNTGSGGSSPLETLVATMVELAGSILHAQVTVHNVGADDDIERASPGFSGLLQFIVQAIPLFEELFRAQSASLSIDLTRPRIPGGVALDKMFVAFFTSPSLVYCLMESFAKSPQFLSTTSAEYLVFNPLLRLDSKHSVSHDTLAAITQYFDNRRTGETAMELILALQLCLIATSLPSDSDKVSQALFESVLRCIKPAYDIHTWGSPPPAIRDPERMGQAGKIAHSILNIMDGSGDGMDQFRIGRPLTSSHASSDEDELNRYSKWCTHFDAKTSRFPDELIDILRRLSEDTADEAGRKFWRVRRLEDLERRQKYR